MEVGMLQAFFKTDAAWLIAGGIFAALTFLVIFTVLKYLDKTSDSRKINQIVKNLGAVCERDVVLSDGLYGYHFIEYLILLKNCILVVSLQKCHGYIFGAEKTDQWAQVYKNKSYHFENPVLQASHCVERVKSIVGEVDVMPRIVFTDESKFPKGKPKFVSELSSLDVDLKQLQDATELNQSIRPYWDKLLSISKQHKRKYEEEKSRMFN